MKTKLKAWQISLLAIFAVMFAAIASIFSLKADTVDEEETPEELVDNWDLDVIFYDSFVDKGMIDSNGNYDETQLITPLTEINWDASDSSYNKGTPRIITVQINYKNINAITTYNSDELEISIPNLIYNTNSNTSAQWTTSVIVGANDKTHTGYDWNFSTSTAPSASQPWFNFTNAKIIEEKSNFEGSIQIIYTITPNSETPEKFDNSCLHSYSKSLKAILKETEPIILPEMESVYTITSPNWPNSYENNMNPSEYYWEYSNPNTDMLLISFDPTSITEKGWDFIRIYDETGGCIYTLSGSDFASKTYCILGNYLKITMSSDYAAAKKGFSASIFCKKAIESNILTFNYSRLYEHPWQYLTFNINQDLSKISAYDNLGSNPKDYIWVKCRYYRYADTFSYKTSKYPYITTKYESYTFKTNIPEECLVYNRRGDLIDTVDEISKTYTIDYSISEWINGTGEQAFIYVGFPKSIYNEENNNLTQTISVDFYAIYEDNTELEYFSSDSDTINLSNFEFTYTGELYSISKSQYSYPTTILRYQDIVNNWNHNKVEFAISAKTRYEGTPLTVKIGDDLLYATDNSGNYLKLNDEDYYFQYIRLYELTNGNYTSIPIYKYNWELFVRYENQSEYILYKTSADKEYSFSFGTTNKVVGFYFIFHDMLEGFSSASIHANIAFNKTNIPENGRMYNFCYLQVFTKNENGELVLQNEPTIDSYANFITKEEIATFDQETYGTYMQRACSYANWEYYNVSPITNEISAYKIASEVTQNAENENFIGTFTIGSLIKAPKDVFSINYFSDYNSDSYVDGFLIYDLLPKGIELTSSKKEIIDSIDIICSRPYIDVHGGYKDSDKFPSIQIFNNKQYEITPKEFYSIIKEKININIIENWNNTGRTKLTISIDLSDDPLMFVTTSGQYYYNIGISLDYNYKISYDSILEYGKTYINNNYSEFKTMTPYKIIGNSKTIDNGNTDMEENDINENGNTTENLSKVSANINITSVISTYQDVTTYVKTDKSNYSTGIIDTSNNSEYEYKLRVRTGAANVTNLIIYTSIEEAQPERTRWKGEFLGVDTTYAENKGYTIKVWYSENTIVGTLVEDSSWQEYNDSIDKSKVKSLAFQYLVETDASGINADAIEPAVLPVNSLTYVLIKMKSPADENIKTLARMDCWTQWNALDEFDQPVDFITGINSNVVKVALPNSVKTDDVPSISLRFTKEITGDEEDFKNMSFNKADNQIFKIRLTNLTANVDGSYNQITALLNSNQELVITQIPIGTYLLEELGDNYFDFVEFTNNNDPEIIIEGVTFEKTVHGYIITVNEDLTETIEFNIKVTNEIESERFFEDKNNEENLFLINKTGIDHNTPED